MVKIISLSNYHETKNNLKELLNNNIYNQECFIEFVYKYSLEQLSYQQIYSNLFKDIYSYLSLNKNDLKLFRKKIIEKCKQNLIKKKVCEENRNIINNNISLIGELINVKILPKKVGIKCLNYLINKFKKYSETNKNNAKYMYLECIIILLNIFCCNIYNYQQERIHDEFNEEIKKIIGILDQIKLDEKNKDIPNYTKHLLLNLIDKANKKWELPTYEKEKYESHFKVFNNGEDKDEENNKSFNDSSFIKEEEYDKSFEEEEKKEENFNMMDINNDGIEKEIDQKANNRYYNKNQNYNINHYNKDYSYKKQYNNNNINNNNDNWRQNDKNRYNNNNNDYKNNNNNYNNNKNNYDNNYNRNNNYYNQNNNNNNINFYRNNNNFSNNSDNNINYYKYNSNNKMNNNNSYYKYNSSNIINNINNNNNKYNNSNSNNFNKSNNYNNKYSNDNISSNMNDSFYSGASITNSINSSANNTININYNIQNKKKYNNRKIILNSLKQFKRHMDSKNNSNNFNWDDIHNLIMESKIGMNDFMEELIESCFSFMINDNSRYYVDLFVKSIFNFYNKYFDHNDISDIKDVVISHLQKLSNNLNYNQNYYLVDLWVIIIYYLINNQILVISDFNIFSREYNYNVKKEVINVLNKVVDYNYEAKNNLKKELKNSKLYNENKKMFEKY